MTRDQIHNLQRSLNQQGYGPLAVDGVYGPATHAAYQRRLTHSDMPDALSVAPPAAKPWWASRAIWGALATIIASLAGLAGYEFDTETTTTLLVSLVTLIAGLVSWWGTIKRKAPIDSTLVVPNLRATNGKLRREQMPTDAGLADPADGYWSSPRGPFDDH
jgi:hypothetical protein